MRWEGLAMGAHYVKLARTRLFFLGTIFLIKGSNNPPLHTIMDFSLLSLLSFLDLTTYNKESDFQNSLSDRSTFETLRIFYDQQLSAPLPSPSLSKFIPENMGVV